MSQGNQHICPRGHTNFPGARFCSICGAPLTPDATIATQAASGSGLQTPKVPPSSPTQYGIPPEVQRYQEEVQWQIPLEYQYPLPDYLAGPQSVSSSTNQESVAPPPPQPQYIPLQPTIPVSQQSTPSIQPLLPQHPRQHLSRGKIFLLVGVVLTLIIASVVIFGAQAYTNHIANVNATATAQTDRNATATAVAKNILNATAVAKAAATATFVADPYPPNSGTLVLFDPLRDNSKGHRWDEGTYSGGARCQFTGGTYHVAEGSKITFQPCFANTTNLGNFVYQAEMTILRGDCGGLVLRADSANNKWYLFEVCQDGTYDIVLYSGNSGKYLVNHTTNAAIKTGLNQTNVIAVVANGGMIQVYVNNTSVDNLVDNSLSQGKIGVFADEYNNSTEVACANVKVWTL